MSFRCVRVFAVFLLLLALGPARASAQTQADLFNDKVLHEIRLTVNSTDWSRLKANYLDDTYYNADFAWRYQGKDVVVQDMAIRNRGTGSRSPVKPGLKLKFDRNEPGQLFLGLKELILRNNTQDASMLHERLSMLFFGRMGMPTLRECSTRFYVNGEYIGLYTIVEAVTQDWLRRNFGEDSGFLYKFQIGATDPPYHWEYRGTNASLYYPTPFKPETNEQTPDPQPLISMLATVNQSADSSFQSDVSKYLDLKFSMAHVAVENYLMEQDGFVGDFGNNNYYIYRFAGKTLHELIPWDKSNTFWDVYFPTKNLDTNALTKRAYAIPEIKNSYLETLMKAAAVAGGPGGWFEQEITREANQTRQAAYEDPNKQCLGPDGNQKPCTNDEFEKEVARIAKLIRDRADYIRTTATGVGFQAQSQAAVLSDGGAVNGATFASGAIAPGSLISIFGSRLAASAGGASSLPLPTTLNGLTVWINGFAAPLLFVSPGQVNVQVPWEVVPGSGLPLAVITNGIPVSGTVSNTIKVDVAASSPGVFVTVHADGSAISADKPAVAGEVLVVYANGLGPVSVNVATGAAAPGDTLATTTQAPSVTIGGVNALVDFSGLTPGLVGLYQVNVRMPANVPAGSRVPLVVSTGGQSAPPVFLATR